MCADMAILINWQDIWRTWDQAPGEEPPSEDDKKP